MANPFFTAVSGAQQNGIGNLFEAAKQFKANPMGFLMQKKYNIPQNLMNDPNAIMNHLLKTGQIQQSQVDAAYKRMRGFGIGQR